LLDVLWRYDSLLESHERDVLKAEKLFLLKFPFAHLKDA